MLLDRSARGRRFVGPASYLLGLVAGCSDPDDVSSGGSVGYDFGHTLGLAHDGATWPGSSAGGFMNDGFSQTPILDWDAPSDICGNPLDPNDCFDQGEVWMNQVPSKFHPRPSGFAHTGCSDDTDCQTGHPGLECSPAQGYVCWPE